MTPLVLVNLLTAWILLAIATAIAYSLVRRLYIRRPR